MAVEIFWSKRADKSFDSILTYLEANLGVHTVTLFVKKVFDLLKSYRNIPKLEQLKIRA